MSITKCFIFKKSTMSLIGIVSTNVDINSFFQLSKRNQNSYLLTESG